MIDPFCLLCKTISFDASRQHPVFNIAFNPSVSPTVICVDRTFPLLNLSEEKKMREKEGSLNFKSDDRYKRPPGLYFNSENNLREKKKLKEEKIALKSTAVCSMQSCLLY